MEIKPVKSADQPKYPLKEEVTAEQLKTSVPQRWTASKVAKVALGTLAAMSLAGCTTAGAPMPTAAVTEGTVLSQSPESGMFAGVPMPASLNVAPLFEHGSGRGAFGCVMVAPPVFLSEEDALAVINEVAKEYGLEFSANNTPEFSNVLQPVTEMYSGIPNSSQSPEKTQPPAYMTLKVDFSDTEHRIAMEYISTEDVRKWNQSEPGISVGTYDTYDAADQLSEALEAVTSDEYAVGVLYDPCEQFQPEDPSMSGDAWEQAEIKSREMSETQLAAQARDFFEWLKAMGVI